MNPFGDLLSRVGELRQFQQSFQGDAGSQVQKMLNSGQMSQEQLNYIMPFAQQLYSYMQMGNKPFGQG